MWSALTPPASTAIVSVLRGGRIEVPTRGLNGCVDAQGALADDAHACPHDACIQAQRLL
jgi:hypothetical protein